MEKISKPGETRFAKLKGSMLVEAAKQNYA